MVSAVMGPAVDVAVVVADMVRVGTVWRSRLARQVNRKNVDVSVVRVGNNEVWQERATPQALSYPQHFHFRGAAEQGVSGEKRRNPANIFWGSDEDPTAR